MRYRRRDSPLHAARAGVAALWCATLGISALVIEHPLVIAALGAFVIAAAYGARVGRYVLRVVLFALPFALIWMVLNPFLVRDGLTVFARFGEVPILGYMDLTVEALLYGTRQGLRLLISLTAFGLLTIAVDPDGLLRLFRRLSFRSALSASLATRLVPVLAADSRRMADAARCRADRGGDGRLARLAVVRAVVSGALDRSLDVAATLEVRGYGSARRSRRERMPWSRHDMAFASSAFGVVVLTAAPLIFGFLGFDPYDLDGEAVGVGDLLFIAALGLVILLPFCDRRGIAR
ncbi:MAG TPA: energy-coupling factor transporter transmembrane component T [Baekduia sp.]|nr:energy-coupling factor transporter transmembrane component T [Baekduia sp.]